MESMHLGKRVFRAVGMCALLVLALCRTAAAQDVTVSGTVSSASGQHLQGVTVRIRGTNTSTTTDADGKYTITAPSDAILVFNVIGFRGVAQTLGGRATVDVAMEPSVAVLPFASSAKLTTSSLVTESVVRLAGSRVTSEK